MQLWNASDMSVLWLQSGHGICSARARLGRSEVQVLDHERQTGACNSESLTDLEMGKIKTWMTVQSPSRNKPRSGKRRTNGTHRESSSSTSASTIWACSISNCLRSGGFCNIPKSLFACRDSLIWCTPRLVSPCFLPTLDLSHLGAQIMWTIPCPCLVLFRRFYLDGRYLRRGSLPYYNLWVHWL